MCQITEKDVDKMWDAEIEYREIESRKTMKDRLLDLQEALARQAHILNQMMITCEKIAQTLKGESDERTAKGRCSNLPNT